MMKSKTENKEGAKEMEKGKELQSRKERLELLTRIMTEVAKVQMLTDYMEKVCLDMNLSYLVSEILEMGDKELKSVDKNKVPIIKECIDKLRLCFISQGIADNEVIFCIIMVHNLKRVFKRSLNSIRNKAISRAIDDLEKEGLEVLCIDLLAVKDGSSSYVTGVYNEEEMKEIIWEDIFRVESC